MRMCVHGQISADCADCEEWRIERRERDTANEKIRFTKYRAHAWKASAKRWRDHGLRHMRRLVAAEGRIEDAIVAARFGPAEDTIEEVLAILRGET